MRIGFLDCQSGVSGDMCLGALVDAGVPLDVLRDTLAGLGLGGYRIESERVRRAGLAATHVIVHLDHHHHAHRGLADVLGIIRAGGLSESVTAKACAVFAALAEAEAAAHDCSTDEVHFHEVGAVDAICDVVGAVAGLEALGIDELLFSRISVGGGTVKTAHGVLPVPAPATAALLKGVPTQGGPVEKELATPTGAAILTTLGRPAPHWPAMAVETTGYGAGTLEFEGVPNVLRLVVGTAERARAAEEVVVLEVNLDDMTGEEIGFAAERLFAAGALDVFTTPVQMKKCRPGVLLTVLAEPDAAADMEAALWRHTTTLGIRRSTRERSTLARRHETVSTPWGDVRVKVGLLDGETIRCEPEYEDCRALAAGADVPLREVYAAARAAMSRK